MKVNSNVYRRIAECKKPTKSRRNAIARTLLAVVAGVLFVIGCGLIGDAMDRQDRAEQMRDTALSKEARNDYQAR